jgi:molybdopterin-containing oxidoreductase family iron-sulfur binding subunit
MSSSSTSRRDFLKYVGFSTAAATLAACRSCKQIDPLRFAARTNHSGVADYYATSVLFLIYLQIF